MAIPVARDRCTRYRGVIIGRVGITPAMEMGSPRQGRPEVSESPGSLVRNAATERLAATALAVRAAGTIAKPSGG
jgi:hypothetical protein